MTNEACKTNKTGMAPIGALTTDDLDVIRGGEVKGYHECVLGSVNGGGPGLYPLYIQCRMK